MIITMLENRKLQYHIREHVPSVLTEAIDEASHIFDRQYEVAEFITGFVVEAILHNKSHVSISMERFNLHFNKIDVNIIKEYAWPGAKAEYLRTDDEGIIYLNILLYKHIALMNYDREQLSKIIKTAIAHELLHTKMGFHRTEHGSKTDFPLPNYYGEVRTALEQSANMDDSTYYFIYSLYIINDTEIPAFVSQVYGEVYDTLLSLKSKESVSKSFRGALSRSQVYESFITLKNELESIQQLNDVKKTELINKISVYVPSLRIKNINNFNKLIAHLIDRVTEAIHTCEECGAKAFYDILGK